MMMESDFLIRREREKDAVRIIERCWCCYRDQQMFQLLKYAVCAAEHSLTYEVLRKLSPSEASLLRDPVFQPKVKFRFSGPDFPPYIVFKVYIQSDGKGVKYLSGKRVIKPASEAASDACRQMGNRKYYNQMITDMCQTEKDNITDEFDVTNLKEYMQYMKNTDEMPANLGGKDNTWRKLSLEALPRQNIMFDVMTYLNSGVASPRLKSEMPELMTSRPLTQSSQLRCIQTIPNTIRRPVVSEKSSGRRTKKAKDRVAKMRQLYGLDDKISPLNPENTAIIETFEEFEDENWEQEGELLYQWSQELSMDNLGQQSPNW